MEGVGGAEVASYTTRGGSQAGRQGRRTRAATGAPGGSAGRGTAKHGETGETVSSYACDEQKRRSTRLKQPQSGSDGLSDDDDDDEEDTPAWRRRTRHSNGGSSGRATRRGGHGVGSAGDDAQFTPMAGVSRATPASRRSMRPRRGSSASAAGTGSADDGNSDDADDRNVSDGGRSDNDESDSADDDDEDSGSQRQPAKRGRYSFRDRRSARRDFSTTVAALQAAADAEPSEPRRSQRRGRREQVGDGAGDGDDSSDEDRDGDEAPEQRRSRRTRRPVEHYSLSGFADEATPHHRQGETRAERANRRAIARAHERYTVRGSGRSDRGRSRGRRHRSRRERRAHFDSSSDSSEADGSDSSADFRRYERKRRERELGAIQPVNGVTNRDRSRADVDPVSIDTSVNWSSVGGLERHVLALREMVILPLLYPEVLHRYQVTPPRGVLFFGPPGTGKTLTARVLANTCTAGGKRVSFFMRKGADCLSKWVGEAERQLRLLFEQATRNQPSIIFFDEIDGLAPVRSAKQDQIHSSIVSTLLALMDGLDDRGQVIVIGATNRLDSIDPALRRPGRFDRELHFGLPTLAGRRAILDIHTKGWSPPLAVPFKNALAHATVGYCGADIKALCAEAALRAVRRRYPQIYESEHKLLIKASEIVISFRDFQAALNAITPASHRAALVHARALPPALVPLLQPRLQTALESVRRTLPLAVADTSRSAPATGASDSEEDVSDTEAEIAIVYGIINRENCTECRKRGDLVCCDTCREAYHVGCIPDGCVMPDLESDDPWRCPSCQTGPVDTSDGGEDGEEGAGSAADSGHGAGAGDSRGAPVASAAQTSVTSPSEEVGDDPIELARALLGDSAGAGGGAPATPSAATVGGRLLGHSTLCRPRFLLHGNGNQGQSVLASALLHSMEELQVIPLDVPSLVAESAARSMEEALVSRVTSARSAAPCILYMPRAELWWEHASDSARACLRMLLDDLPSSLPVLLLATCECDASELPDELQSMLNSVEVAPHLSRAFYEVRPADDEERRGFYNSLVDDLCPRQPVAGDAGNTTAAVKRKRRRRDEVLKLAPPPPPPPGPTKEEKKRQAQKEEHYLRELRIYMRSLLADLIRTPKFRTFRDPVDPEEVPDYYTVIENPMCLEVMREKIDEREYMCMEDMVDDIELIASNALEYNPDNSSGRRIVHAANALKDAVASGIHQFKRHIRYPLVERCKAIADRRRGRSHKDNGEGSEANGGAGAGAGAAPSTGGRMTRNSARRLGLQSPDILLELPMRTPRTSRKHSAAAAEGSEAAEPSEATSGDGAGAGAGAGSPVDAAASDPAPAPGESGSSSVSVAMIAESGPATGANVTTASTDDGASAASSTPPDGEELGRHAEPAMSPAEWQDLVARARHLVAEIARRTKGFGLDELEKVRTTIAQRAARCSGFDAAACTARLEAVEEIVGHLPHAP